MGLEAVSEKGLVLLGCGKMGSALLAGWIKGGVKRESVTVIEPNPGDFLREERELGVRVNAEPPESPAVAVVAVKPQIVAEALPALKGLAGGETLFLSIAAGATLGKLERLLGRPTPVIRSIPNTPAAIGKGVTAFVGNGGVTAGHERLAESLLNVVGEALKLPSEDLMDAVTAVSGSGPAYVFLLTEALAEAGEKAGLEKDLSMRLAKATVAGAGALMEESVESPGTLRENVTSPQGTTEAALRVLMDRESGVHALMEKAVLAAKDRGAELGE